MDISKLQNTKVVKFKLDGEEEEVKLATPALPETRKLRKEFYSHVEGASGEGGNPASVLRISDDFSVRVVKACLAPEEGLASADLDALALLLGRLRPRLGDVSELEREAFRLCGLPALLDAGKDGQGDQSDF